MTSLSYQSSESATETCVLLGLAVVSAVLGVAADTVFADAAVFPLVTRGEWGQFEGWYPWPGVYPARSFFLALASLLFVAAIWPLGGGGPATVTEGAAGAAGGWRQLRLLVLWAVVGIALLFLAIFLERPKLFGEMSLDDGPVETASAVMLFAASAILATGAFKTLHSVRGPNRLLRLGCGAMALFLFFVGMEEISWGQRLFGFATPRGFAANDQAEFNLHNFNTSFLNACYYSLGFVFFILLPFLKDRLEGLAKVEVLAFFIPSRFVLFASAIGVAYAWARWSELVFQMSFFLTFFILAAYTWHFRMTDSTFVLPAVFLTFTLTQVAIILYGENLTYHWEVNEYREFFIPLSFLIYAIEMSAKFRSRARPA